MLHLRELRRTIKDAYRQQLLSRIAGTRLKELARVCNGDPRCLVDTVIGFENNSVFHPRSIEDITVRPTQVRAEIIALADLLAKQHLKRVVEIGTNNGGTLFLWSQLAARDATLISVDLPDGPFGGGYPSWRGALYHSFTGASQVLHLIRDDSHEPGTAAKVRELLKGESVDFLFIDGDHTYEGVKQDFETYAPLVRPGGIVAFHDILPHPAHPDCQVDRFWSEVKSRYPYEEFVGDPGQDWAGIGVLFIPPTGTR